MNHLYHEQARKICEAQDDEIKGGAEGRGRLPAIWPFFSRAVLSAICTGLALTIPAHAQIQFDAATANPGEDFGLRTQTGGVDLNGDGDFTDGTWVLDGVAVRSPTNGAGRRLGWWFATAPGNVNFLMSGQRRQTTLDFSITFTDPEVTGRIEYTPQLPTTALSETGFSQDNLTLSASWTGAAATFLNPDPAEITSFDLQPNSLSLVPAVNGGALPTPADDVLCFFEAGGRTAARNQCIDWSLQLASGVHAVTVVATEERQVEGARFDVVSVADLIVNQTVSANNLNEGDSGNFTITVLNNNVAGNSVALNTLLTSLLPAGLSFDSVSISTDGATNTGGTYDETTGIWSLGRLSVGETATLVINFTVDAGTGGSTLTNTIAEPSIVMTQTDEVDNHLTLSQSVTVVAPPALPPANTSIEVCAAPGTGAFPAQPPVAGAQVFWTGNTPFQTLNATLNGDDFASADPFSVGPGAGLNFLGTGVAIAGIDQTSAADAFANGDYVDYSFTTAADLPAGRSLSNISRQSLFATTFNFNMTVLVSDEPTFGSAHLVVDNARISQAPRTFHAFSTPLVLQPSTQYYVRVLTYNNDTPSGLVGYDDLVLTTELCADYSDTPASFTNVTHAQQVELQTHFLGAGISNDVGVLASPSADADDDDGVTIPALTQGQTVTITADVTGAGGFLQGWIDFDGSGTFEAGEQVATNIGDETGDDIDGIDGSITFEVTVPSDATTDQTFARFRWSTTAGLDATAAALDGEVEDYAVTIAEGAAPVISIPPTTCGNLMTAEFNGTFGTLTSGVRNLQSPVSGYSFAGTTNNGAGQYSVISQPASVSFHPSGIIWDNVLGFTTGNADDAYLAVNGSTSEGVFFQQSIALTGGEVYQVSAFSLNAIIDPPPGTPGFGAFASELGVRLIRVSDEQVIQTVSSGILDAIDIPSGPSDWTQIVMDVTIPTTDTYRLEVFNISTQSSGNDFAIDQISIAPLNESGCPTDFSDAPISTLGGARHSITPDFFLGAGVTSENADFDSANADGDTDDGITIPTLTQGQTATITAEVTGAGGFLQGWIDFDGDGDFDDAGEQIAVDLQDSDNDDEISISVSIPSDATTDQTFARFRWSTTSGLDATTAAPDGEVEDYAVTVGVPTSDPGGALGVCPFVTDFDGLTPEYDSTPFYALGQNLNGQHVESTGSIPSDASGSGSFLFHNTFNAPAGQTVNGESWGTVTPATVEPNTNYVFTFQMANQNGINREIIQPQINGVDVGGTFTTSSTGVWETFEVVWNSGAATTADLSLVQTRGGTSGGGLDWGFDEISLCPALDQSDAPDSFQTAAHAIVDGFRLGAAIDSELAGASSDASGDGADDDGITISALTQGETATITADVTGAGGFLQGWIDFDGSGTFEAGEQVATNIGDETGDDVDGIDGSITFEVTVPSDATTDQTFARFRWSTTSGLDATTAAPDGEVEDYALTIEPGTIPISGTVFLDNGTGAGAIAHDGLIQGDEPGEGAVTVEAVDALTGDLVDTVQTNADGTYTLELPITQDGRETIIRITPPTATFVIANVSGFPVTEVDPAGGVFTLTPAAGIARAGLDFGLAGEPRLTEDQTRTVAAGSAVTLPHTFTASSPVDVTFSLEDITESVEGIFTATLFEDVDCDQAIGASDTVITGQRTLAAEEAVCLIVRVSAAAGAPSQTDIRYTLRAEGTYANSAAGFTLDNTDRVSIADDNGLTLTKTVCNATTDTCDLLSGAGFSPINTGAPGDRLIYRIGFEAAGPEPVTDLVIFDRTPAFSSLSAMLPSIDPQTTTLSCALTVPATPAEGYEGPLEWRCTGDLPPGSAGIASFEVRISD